ncbi:MAG: Flp family type IVb pilin [Planctomycetota bacterium]
MKTLMKNLGRTLKSLHDDEGGADMVEYILVVAAIALPLLGVVIWFWKDISREAASWWDKAKGQEGLSPDELN